MFKRFKRRTDKPSVMHGLFQRIGNVVEGTQRRLSAYLNHKTRHITGRRLLIALLIFCIAFGGAAGYVFWQAMHTTAKTGAVKMIRVLRPAVPNKQADERMPAVLTDSEIKRIQSFQYYLDSLQGTPTGKRLYDSIQRHRPGLLDSLALIQQVYHEQLKTK